MAAPTSPEDTTTCSAGPWPGREVGIHWQRERNQSRCPRGRGAPGLGMGSWPEKRGPLGGVTRSTPRPPAKMRAGVPRAWPTVVGLRACLSQASAMFCSFSGRVRLSFYSLSSSPASLSPFLHCWPVSIPQAQPDPWPPWDAGQHLSQWIFLSMSWGIPSRFSTPLPCDWGG